MSDLVQWVNLPNDEDFAKKVKLDPARVGSVLVDIAFKDDSPATSKVRFVAAGGQNVDYEKGEWRRNGAFKMFNQRGTHMKPAGVSRHEAGTAVVLPAAGNNRYKAVARDAAGNIVESETFVARRRVYWQELFVDDDSADVEAIMGKVATTFSGDDIALEFEKSAPKAALKEPAPNEGDASSYISELIAEAEAVLDVPDRRVGLGIIVVHQLATKRHRPISIPMQLAARRGGTRDGSWSFDGSELVITTPEYLWYAIADAADRRPTFLHSRPSLIFDIGNGRRQGFHLDATKARVVGPPLVGDGGYRKFALDCSDVKDDLQRLETFPAVLAVDLAVLGSWPLGYQIPRTNFVLLGRRCEWMDVTPSKLQNTALHEVAHHLGLAASGELYEGRATHTPDPHDDYYDEFLRPGLKDHRGPHCAYGVTFSATDTPIGKPRCVMWGADAVLDDVAGDADQANEPDEASELCPGCKKSARKLDLSNLAR